jgi:hypothetical protein
MALYPACVSTVVPSTGLAVLTMKVVICYRIQYIAVYEPLYMQWPMLVARAKRLAGSPLRASPPSVWLSDTTNQPVYTPL